MTHPSRALLPTLALGQQTKTLELAWFAFLAVAGSILLAISAKVQVPFGLVPGTMQTLVVFALAASLGARLALATLALYLLEGTLGLPVFATATGLAGPTGGYLAGFLVAAGIVGYAADKGFDRNPFTLFAAMLVGEIIVMALGFAWLSGFIGAETAWTAGVAPFIVADLVKIGLAACIVPALWTIIQKLRA